MTYVTKDQLEDFWIELIKIKDFMKKEEVHFFTHCTHLNGRRSIDDQLTITGYPTDLPALAPLAKDEKIKGIWFEIHPRKLPDKSPYGNCRLTFKAKHLMDYLSSQFTNDKAVHLEDDESQCQFNENNANIDDNEENPCIEDVTVSNHDEEKRLTNGYKHGQEYVKDDLAIGHDSEEETNNEEKYMDVHLENKTGSNETNKEDGDDDNDEEDNDNNEEEEGEGEEEKEEKSDDDDDYDVGGEGGMQLQLKDVIVPASTENGKQEEGCLHLKDNFKEYVKVDLPIGHNNEENTNNEEKYMDVQLENKTCSNETKKEDDNDDDDKDDHDDDAEDDDDEEDDHDDDDDDEEEGEGEEEKEEENDEDDDDDDDDDEGNSKLQLKNVIVPASTENDEQEEGCLQLKDNLKDKENSMNDVSKAGPEQLVFSSNKKSKNHHGINLKFSSNITLEERYKKYKREDFLKDIIKPSRIIAPLVFQFTGPKMNPLLFLECCHFYGNSQYVRFVLIRPTDSLVGWCYENLKPVDIENNPFFEYHENSRQVFSSRLHGGWKLFFLNILVIGNIHLNNFRKFELPNWDKVKKLRRAGRDPKIGFVKKKR